MPTYCCVPLCKNRGGHLFPKDKKKRAEWLQAVRRDKWVPTHRSTVCSSHFKDSDYIEASITYHGAERSKRSLKTNAVPSVFEWTKERSTSSIERDARMTEKACTRAAEEEEFRKTITRSAQEHVQVALVEELVGPIADDHHPAEPAQDHPSESDQQKRTFVNAQTQASVSPAKISVEELSANPTMLHYYTGLVNYQSFMYVFRTLGEAAYHLNYRENMTRKISVMNEFLLTLVRLRCYIPFIELSYLFGIRERYVSNIFITWINFMYVTWKMLDIWPSADMVRFYSPSDFRRLYPTTRVILDGVETPVKKPSNPKLQRITYSSYKSRNTLKSVPGITPGGLVSFIPPVYGGSVSDRAFIERSNLPQMCQPGDSIMVDKGFDVQDLFAPYDVTVNVPTFLKRGNQFTIAQLQKDRKIASKRVHVERVIGLAKTYKILQRPMNDIETVLGDRIYFVCFMLCNFRPCIVPEDA